MCNINDHFTKSCKIPIISSIRKTPGFFLDKHTASCIGVMPLAEGAFGFFRCVELAPHLLEPLF